ncbi:uncharacterized protein LOC111197155 isoform X2 [Astyanax mexicanus]|uniref:uncharacterized protein LOC111197155 isoform X1 n=2 Tax=Astyanax mexicanus TaxID=7994 RepID=UPI0020CAE0C0|nr:uncharacterized protein LOC111197155 isoform X1 [Astyanax mexicanus]XP_022542317.2 uncharacterized protein LOC111197155 isoform X1 [Astyanax mexicanus]XP_049332308.1 uncharacterized protein LOC111197155 isoform X2 [Astyanax mexicanus]
MSRQKKITEDFLSPQLMKCGAQKYLEEIGSFVSKHSGAKIKLKKVERYNFRVGSLKDTSYKNTDLLQEWEQFYLPDEMKMVVIGVLENFPCGEDSAELVLMVCEDGNVFAYEDERLHLVASSLKELFESGVQFPGSKYYYRGQSFEDMTKDDWNEVKQSKEAMEKHKKHQDMLESIKPTLLKNLEIIKERQQGEPPSEGSEMSVPLLVS